MSAATGNHIDDIGTFFAEHGWAVVRDVVPVAVRLRLLADFDQLLPTSLYAHPTASSPVVEVIGASRAFPTILRQATDAAIGRLVARALGCRRVQFLQDTLMLKPPRNGGRVEWHQDHTYTGFLDPAASVTVRLALTECTVANGCMNVLDGSHTWGLIGETRIFSAASVTDTLALLPSPWAERVPGATRALELAPGDISLHHCLSFHGSLENHSPHPRKTLIARYFDADCKLLPARLPSPAAAVLFPTDDEGHLCLGAFPLVHGCDGEAAARKGERGNT